jgi:glc operon protein GlcG
MLAGTAAAQVAAKKTLTIDGAKRVAAAAVAEAKRVHAAGAIAVVDDGGNLMYLERLDGTFAAGATVSVGKARTAVLFRKPTRFFEDVIRNGRTPMIALPDFTPLQGGVPIVVDGEVIGGIGVSGASSAQQDDEIAMAGAAAKLDTAMAGCDGCGGLAVTHLARGDVDAAFRKGQPLLEVRDYKVHASRRDAAGQAEIHAHDTDVFYVLDGRATFVTGGELVGAKATGADEARGEAIRGGDERVIQKGDVVVVPAGVPHWFKAVDGPVTYLAVKVTHGSAVQ